MNSYWKFFFVYITGKTVKFIKRKRKKKKIRFFISMQNQAYLQKKLEKPGTATPDQNNDLCLPQDGCGAHE